MRGGSENLRKTPLIVCRWASVAFVLFSSALTHLNEKGIFCCCKVCAELPITCGGPNNVRKQAVFHQGGCLGGMIPLQQKELPVGGAENRASARVGLVNLLWC